MSDDELGLSAATLVSPRKAETAACEVCQQDYKIADMLDASGNTRHPRWRCQRDSKGATYLLSPKENVDGAKVMAVLKKTIWRSLPLWRQQRATH